MTLIFSEATSGSGTVDIPKGLRGVESQLFRADPDNRTISFMQSQNIQVMPTSQDGKLPGDA